MTWTKIRTLWFVPRMYIWLIWYPCTKVVIQSRSWCLLIEIDKISPSDSLFAEVDSRYMRNFLPRQASIAGLGRGMDWFLTLQPMIDLGEHPKIQLSVGAVQVISCWCDIIRDHCIDGLCQGLTVWLTVLRKWNSDTWNIFYQGKRPLPNLVAELIDFWYYRRRLTWVKHAYLTVLFESSHADVWLFGTTT